MLTPDAMPDTIQVRSLSTADREILLAMYRTFDPLGVAQGLPPRNEEARQIWIGRAIEEEINVGAFSPAGELAGHGFLASSAVLQRAGQNRLRRIWAMTASDNLPALRLLKRCGFRSSRFTFPVVELELELPAPVSS
jgi:ribosomal protein S18 acetylase RimI-like enzyme